MAQEHSSHIQGVPSAFAKDRRKNFQTGGCKVILLNPWPKLLRCWTFCSRVHILVCKFRHPYAGVSCSMVYNMLGNIFHRSVSFKQVSPNFIFFKQCCAISGLSKQVEENHPQSKRNMAKCSCSVLP